MDLKFKGNFWVGNIYQKLETVCQEVDNIVRQDSVKYVGNQVQTVGKSLKKFCSDVVEDFLPPSVDKVKNDAQAVVLNGGNSSIGNNIMSMIGIEENPTGSETNLATDQDVLADDKSNASKKGNAENENHTSLKSNLICSHHKESLESSLSTEFVVRNHDYEDRVSDEFVHETSANTLANQLVHGYCELNLVNEATTPILANSLEEAETVSAPGQISDIFGNGNSNVSPKENADKEYYTSAESDVISLGEREFSEALFSGESVGCNYEYSFGILDKVLHETSAALVENQLGDSSDGILCVNNVTTTAVIPVEEADSAFAPGLDSDVLKDENPNESTEENAQKENSASVKLDIILPDRNKSFDVSLSSKFVSCNHDYAYGVVDEVLPATSTDPVDNQLGDTFSGLHLLNATTTPASVNPVEEAETGLPPGLALSSICCEEKTSATGLVTSTSSELMDSCSLSKISREKSPIKAVSYNAPTNVATHVGASSNFILPFESFSTVPSGNKVVAKEAFPFSSMLSSETIGCCRRSHTNDSVMRTVGLCKDTRPEDTCDVVDDRMLYAVSRRVRNLRSYKKKIQDAFYSRKRLAKEYEQLPIWFGDVNLEASQDRVSLSNNLENSDLEPVDDSEWELL
ncbi:uncharacterized protein LOC119985009 isoform X2 [Tripterygium wilfordii]|uniref:uncharacterized protein LOC119985009 isoform X2 n=1 Tax=Tripterygium wilfordii TaxID=458696 RepID=UPI0018F85A11|nr:uncharacterized protein LOC119985009 isoform X2 [Tripterygium wilfordii]